MAQRLARGFAVSKVPGSNPGRSFLFDFCPFFFIRGVFQGLSHILDGSCVQLADRNSSLFYRVGQDACSTSKRNILFHADFSLSHPLQELNLLT